jgi:very-short-patch-repair endonuclease
MKRRVGLRRTGFASHPRHRMSAAEAALSARFDAAPFGAVFRSQMPVGQYVADFGSYELKLIIEIDGEAHDPRRGDSHARTVAFESAGYLVLSFTEGEILADIDRVIDEIAQATKVWSG